MDTLQPFEQSFMITPRPDQKPSYLFTPPPDTDNFLVETFHQYPHGNFCPTFYNPFEIKHRRRTSRAQLKVLEEAFQKYAKPSASVRRILAQKLDMSPRGVQIWFQNRRAKAKQQQQEKHDTIDDTSVLFSGFSQQQDQKEISDSVRELATNAAIAAVSNWPNSVDLSKTTTPEYNNAIYLSPSWSPSIYSEINNYPHFDQNFNFLQQQLTPPPTVPGSPIPPPLNNLFTDPIVLPNDQELYCSYLPGFI